MIGFLLVVWFGYTTQQTSFSVPGIASLAECQRLGSELHNVYRQADVQCFPYRMAK